MFKSNSPLGALQDNYIIGINDELIIVLQGGKNQVLRKK